MQTELHAGNKLPRMERNASNAERISNKDFGMFRDSMNDRACHHTGMGSQGVHKGSHLEPIWCGWMKGRGAEGG